MQVGRLVELVIRGLDIAAVIAADLQESAYVIVEVLKHTAAGLGVAGKIAVGIVSPIELCSPIVRPRCLPVKGIVGVTDCEIVACGIKKEQTGVMPICSLDVNSFFRRYPLKIELAIVFLHQRTGFVNFIFFYYKTSFWVYSLKCIYIS